MGLTAATDAHQAASQQANGSGRKKARVNGKQGPTTTSRFGVGRRENHDASDFYDRFATPQISDEAQINPPLALDQIWEGDAREMDRYGQVADNSVALVVTSPPYFAGKEYEAALGEGHVPESYRAFLQMLEDVFAECVRKLEPGGRMAVNVANLGRKPYRSLSADVINIFQRLGLLLRGEIIWVKGKAAGGSCAWGSFQQPTNPVLRDLSERVIVASKGRFDRAQNARTRAKAGLPAEASITADEFMDLTYDIWELPPVSARSVGHPAPFPVELPRRLLELYTYRGDLVLDPFMGAGSTALAAVQTGRHYVGFDTDREYIDRATERLAELEADETTAAGGEEQPLVLPGRVLEALDRGRKSTDVARALLEEAGWSRIEEKVKVAPGVEVSFRAQDGAGRAWLFDVVGGFSAGRPGLGRADGLWAALGKASVVAASRPGVPLVLLSPELPRATGPLGKALLSVSEDGPGRTVTAALPLADPESYDRLQALRG